MWALVVCFNTFFVCTFLGEELIISTLLDFYHFPLTFYYIYIYIYILDYLSYMFLILFRFTGIIHFFIIFISIVNMFYNYVDYILV